MLLRLVALTQLDDGLPASVLPLLGAAIAALWLVSTSMGLRTRKPLQLLTT
jgi:hypothetical protein